jgi:hypothetical protein
LDSQVFVEDWTATYGSPYMVTEGDESGPTGRLVEDGSNLLIHDGIPEPPAQTLAFVDGVRRGEASLYQRHPTTHQIARGVAGAHACGCVLTSPGARPEFGEQRISRLVVWGSGLSADLPDVAGGWRWKSVSVADGAPDTPLKDIQARMRQEEGRLAEDLARAGHLVIVDGPLTYVRSRDIPVVGYVKTHYRTLLEPEDHARIPELGPGQRSSLFALGDDRYSCYVRLTQPTPWSGPWAGIVRLEIPQSSGLDAAIDLANRVAGAIPRFAGVPHVDPRAPQNLQPVGALETRLKHQLGDLGLAQRAVRESVRLATMGVSA